MMKDDCNRVQEEIAWGRLVENPAHVLDCPDCRKTALDFAALDSLFGADVQVPLHFADQVMRRVARPRLVRDFSGLRLQFAYICGAAAVLFMVFLPSAV